MVALETLPPEPGAVPPLPAYRVERGSRSSRIGLLMLLLVLAGLAAMPWWGSRAGMRLVIRLPAGANRMAASQEGEATILRAGRRLRAYSWPS